MIILNNIKILTLFFCCCCDNYHYHCHFPLQAILCFIVLQDLSYSKEDIKTHLSRILLPYMMPKIIIVEKFPLLSNGKIDRQKLLESYDSSSEEGKKYSKSVEK